jgi:hypothetical protein
VKLVKLVAREAREKKLAHKKLAQKKNLIALVSESV